MLIKVIYQDNRHDMVKPFLLDNLLDARKLKMFHRSDGWAIIGFSPMRNRMNRFNGKDRRLHKSQIFAHDEAHPSKTTYSAALISTNQRKQNCWEYMQCGREFGGMNILEFGVCPASTLRNLDGIHSGKNAGRACWVVAGTMCHGEPQGTFSKKIKSCGRCPFYRSVSNEEENRFATIVLLELSQAKDSLQLEPTQH